MSIAELQLQITALKAQLTDVTAKSDGKTAGNDNSNVISNAAGGYADLKCRFADLQLIPAAWMNDAKREEFLAGAAADGKLQDVAELIKTGTDPSKALQTAAAAGRKQVVEILLGLDDPSNLMQYLPSSAWNQALLAVCGADVRAITNRYISVAKKYGGAENGNDQQSSTKQAEAAVLSVAGLLLDPPLRGHRKEAADDLNGGLRMACRFGNRFMAEYLISENVFGLPDFDDGLKSAYDGLQAATASAADSKTPVDRGRWLSIMASAADSKTPVDRGRWLSIMASMLKNGAPKPQSVFKLPRDDMVLIELIEVYRRQYLPTVDVPTQNPMQMLSSVPGLSSIPGFDGLALKLVAIFGNRTNYESVFGSVFGSAAAAGIAAAADTKTDTKTGSAPTVDAADLAADLAALDAKIRYLDGSLVGCRLLEADLRRQFGVDWSSSMSASGDLAALPQKIRLLEANLVGCRLLEANLRGGVGSSSSTSDSGDPAASAATIRRLEADLAASTAKIRRLEADLAGCRLINAPPSSVSAAAMIDS